MASTGVATNHMFAKIIERQKLLPNDILDRLATGAKSTQEWLGQTAVDAGFLTYEEIAIALAHEMKLPLVNLRITNPDQRALQRLSADKCRAFGAVPLSYDNGVLHLAMANPLDDASKAGIKTAVQCECAVQVAPYDAILRIVDEWYADAGGNEAKPQVNEDLRAMLSELRMPEEKKSQQPIFAGAGSVRSGTELILEDLLIAMFEQKASDLHLAAGSPPLIRVDGDLQPLQYAICTPNVIQETMYAILTDVQITQFERHWELDFSYSLPGISRFRVNMHRQRGSVGAVFRIIPVEIPTLDKLKMPPIILEMTKKPRGLVLVTGPTGSGKSTTLAAMIDEINRTLRTHIVTIEDPIEFLHNNKLSVVTQREVGSDTEGFGVALRHVLRQDPDVILIGEMRDLETISAALTAAETGHLVFATLHTTSAAQTIDRVIDVFPDAQQEQVRAQLANVLEGIISQTLLPRSDGKGRACAQEVMVCTPAIRTLIRDNKVHQMPSVIQASAKYGMQTLDSALRTLVTRGIVTLDEAIKKSSNPDDFKAMVAMQ